MFPQVLSPFPSNKSATSNLSLPPATSYSSPTFPWPYKHLILGICCYITKTILKLGGLKWQVIISQWGLTRLQSDVSCRYSYLMSKITDSSGWQWVLAVGWQLGLLTEAHVFFDNFCLFAFCLWMSVSPPSLFPKVSVFFTLSPPFP